MAESNSNNFEDKSPRLVSDVQVDIAPKMDETRRIDAETHRFPHSLVWVPIPLITWFLPFVGHLGIAMSNGVIRDFAGSYFVSEDHMGFGWPSRYLQLDLARVNGGAAAWDRAVYDASEEYKGHCHNLICDNCHSHAALALNTMQYDGSTRWNMVTLAALLFFKGRYVSVSNAITHWLPFAIMCTIVAIFVIVL